MNILFIGDIVGKLGRDALIKNLPTIKEKYDISFVVANAENVTNGKGMSQTHYSFLIENGVDCITLGNHYNHQAEIYNIIENKDVIRPLNLADETKGHGTEVFMVDGVKIRVTNLLGTMVTPKDRINDPYQTIIDVIGNDDSDIHIIDYHGEFTGEKKAFAYSLKNTVSAICGTHTHTQTRDYQKLSTGPLFITDVGMCGLYDSVLGVEYNSVVDRIIHKNEKSKFKQLYEGKTLFSAVVLKFDDFTFEGKEIIPLYIIN